MEGFDFSTSTHFRNHPPAVSARARFVIVCGADELKTLMDVFKWDADTVEECTNIDETVRYTSYDGYDFISLIYAEINGGGVTQQELNLFFSHNYLVLVIPETAGKMLLKLAEEFERTVKLAVSRNEPLIFLYYFVFDTLAKDYSDMLEYLEDETEALAEAIEKSPDKSQSNEIGILRKTVYTYKKLLRSLSYIGGQILIDENKLLDSVKSRYFRNIDTRLIRLYDFADDLYDLTQDLLNLYDSKFSAQMNEMVNKLTIITIFFGPMTVIAGIYGMNFKHMPELNWVLGYPSALGLMVLISVIIYRYLKKNKWL